MHNFSRAGIVRKRQSQKQDITTDPWEYTVMKFTANLNLKEHKFFFTNSVQRLKPLKRNTGNLPNINQLLRTNLIQIPLRNYKQTTLNFSSRDFVPSIDEIRVFIETLDTDLSLYLKLG